MLWKREISQLVFVISSQYGVLVPYDCYRINGNENHFEGRYQISQSHQATLKVSTFHIVNHNCSKSVEVLRQSCSFD
jgi:hypothetical protein